MKLVTFLKCLGLEPVFDLEQKKDNPQDIKHKEWKLVFNYLYPLIIWLFLWYHPILITTVAFTDDHKDILPRACFSFIQPIQYYVAFWYFRSQRTKRIYESRNLEFLDNPNGMWKYLPKEKTLLHLIFSISFVFIIEAIAVFIITVEESNSYYDELSSGMKGLGYFIIPISLVYGRFTLTLNTHVFLFSFFQQIQKMQALREKLGNQKWKEGRNLSVAALCYEIFDLRYTVSRMIGKLEDMYTFTTILGSIGIGLLLTTSEFDFQTVTGTVIFLIMQVFFLFVIQSIGKERDGFRKVIHHRKFASTYILRRNEFCQACLEVQRESNEKELFQDLSFDIEQLTGSTPEPTGNLRPFPKKRKHSTLRKDIRAILAAGIENDEENGNSCDVSIDVQRIQQTRLESPDDPVEIVDEESEAPTASRELETSRETSRDHHVPSLDDSPDDVFQKRSLGGSNEEKSGDGTLSSFHQQDSMDESEDIRQQIKKLLETGGIGDPHILADSGCSLTTDEFIRCIYEWVTNTGSTVDWMVLNSILNEDWASFGMFGVEFSDGSALRKAIYMTTLLVGVGSALGFLEEWEG
jgi:hypothetical protein